MGFAPTDVTAWRRGLIKRNQLVARAAGIMSDNRVFRIESAHEFPENSIGIDRYFFGSELGHPLLQPGLSYFLDLRCYQISLFWSVRSLSIFHCFNKLPEHRLGITEDWDVGNIVFIEVALVVSRMNDGFAGGNRRCDNAMPGKTRANSEHDIGCPQKLVHCG